MVFINTILSAFMVALAATGALASDEGIDSHRCKGGQVYCGHHLLKLSSDKYREKIKDQLAAHNITADDFNVRNSEWSCLHGDAIGFTKLCKVGCIDAGKKDDYCDVNAGSSDGGLDERDVEADDGFDEDDKADADEADADEED
ncbi:hypothetical protein F4808DRAFT_475733 [Astrocystis sublimbata]|nr:hypothetical protein F4808DRAFT_475733 [Astrocystis sublimbata]